MDICQEVAEYKIATGKKVFDKEREQAKLDTLKAVCTEGRFGFGTAELDEYLCKYEKACFPPVSHSEAYRQAYKPSYRIIRI